MIKRRDLWFIALGALIGGAGVELAGRGTAIAFLAGAALTGLLCWRSLRDLSFDREAEQLARESFQRELLAAWQETDTLRIRLALAQTFTYPPISDLSRSARSQEPPPCSSATN